MSVKSAAENSADDPEEEAEVSYDDSTVKTRVPPSRHAHRPCTFAIGGDERRMTRALSRYSCEEVHGRTRLADLAVGVGGLAPMAGCGFREPLLKRVYSMSFRC